MRLVLLVALLLGACVSMEDVDARLRAWIGSGENSLTARWGAPDKSYDRRDGTRVLTYTYEYNGIRSVPGVGLRHVQPRFETDHDECRVTFEIDREGNVTSAFMEGDLSGCSALVKPKPG